MLREMAFHGARLLAAGGDGDSTFKVALVTTGGVVIAAAITSYAGTFQRNRTPAPTPAPAPAPTLPDTGLSDELRQRAERAETRADRLAEQLEERDERVDELESMLIDAGVNPHRPHPDPVPDGGTT